MEFGSRVMSGRFCLHGSIARCQSAVTTAVSWLQIIAGCAQAVRTIVAIHLEIDDLALAGYLVVDTFALLRTASTQ